jgi:lysophospholipase L1-like esterase
MARASASVGAKLIVLNIPYFERGGTGAMPAPLKEALAQVAAPNVSTLDLAPIVARHYADPSAPLLRFDRDRHPNPAAHALIAEAIDGFVRGQGLVPGLPAAR